MATPYVGEIRMFAGNFAPAGWEFCHGQWLSIAENDTLFSLIGTTYGGDGVNTFALPDLRGRLPVHQNTNHPIGETFGVETVTLNTSQMPAHTHPLTGNSNSTLGVVTATSTDPTGNVMGKTSRPIYVNSTSTVAMAQQAISSSGGSQPHTNIQPFLCINFIIALYGIYPSPS
ncbi:phage tail protein [Nostoc sp. FACHB-145]|uniref:phage tail protein n=1 Tax=Nostoc sp. FACHB-145 TaxID=2692836 RepID=UPI0016892301|nr:tail fiber protein [Nostoc sp. FACHB-145]MBD2472967.1 phage tail protein [Nostoc sp. FACHB-145]